MPRVSIVIRTYFRAHLLRMILESLTKLSYPKSLLETLIIADSRDLQAIKVANQFTKALDVKIHLVGVNSATHAWNRGILESTGEIISIMPDDIRVHPNTIDVALKHLRDPKVACVTFPAVTLKPSLPEKLHHWRFKGIITKNTFSILVISICKRDALESVGLFREDMGPPYSLYEDWELGSRIRSKGYTIVADGTLLQEHLEYLDSEHKEKAEKAREKVKIKIIGLVKTHVTYQLKKNWWAFFAVMKVSPLIQKLEYLFYLLNPMGMIVILIINPVYLVAYSLLLVLITELNSFIRKYYIELSPKERLIFPLILLSIRTLRTYLAIGGLITHLGRKMKVSFRNRTSKDTIKEVKYREPDTLLRST
ncbi:MAG: glycosyltransferase [Thermofilaceae archaeon]